MRIALPYYNITYCIFYVKIILNLKQSHKDGLPLVPRRSAGTPSRFPRHRLRGVGKGPSLLVLPETPQFLPQWLLPRSPRSTRTLSDSGSGARPRNSQSALDCWTLKRVPQPGPWGCLMLSGSEEKEETGEQPHELTEAPPAQQCALRRAMRREPRAGSHAEEALNRHATLTSY